MIHPQNSALLSLLQLASPSLPVGAYSYSEGLESLVDLGIVQGREALEHWLIQELRLGAVRLEAAIAVRCYAAVQEQDWVRVQEWNRWLSAARETEELRLQSWQMGRSLVRLLSELHPECRALFERTSLQSDGCNFAVAFAIAAAHRQIELPAMVLAYLYSWASNGVSAGVKLIPLGQTAGQQLLLTLHSDLETTCGEILRLPDAELDSCGWGLALASMSHETQYSRLFRS